jgi:hypothetical protein
MPDSGSGSSSHLTNFSFFGPNDALLVNFRLLEGWPCGYLQSVLWIWQCTAIFDKKATYVKGIKTADYFPMLLRILIALLSLPSFGRHCTHCAVVIALQK